MSNVWNQLNEFFEHAVQVSLKSFGVLIGLFVTSVLKITLTSRKLSWWQVVLEVLISYLLGLFCYFVLFPFNIYYALICSLIGDKICSYFLSYSVSDIRKIVNYLINLKK